MAEEVSTPVDLGPSFEYSPKLNHANTECLAWTSLWWPNFSPVYKIGDSVLSVRQPTLLSKIALTWEWESTLSFWIWDEIVSKSLFTISAIELSNNVDLVGLRVEQWHLTAFQCVLCNTNEEQRQRLCAWLYEVYVQKGEEYELHPLTACIK